MRFLLFLTVLVIGCSSLGCSGNPAPTPPTTTTEKLPLEVSGAPENALPKNVKER